MRSGGGFSKKCRRDASSTCKRRAIAARFVSSSSRSTVGRTRIRRLSSCRISNAGNTVDALRGKARVARRGRRTVCNCGIGSAANESWGTFHAFSCEQFGRWRSLQAEDERRASNPVCFGARNGRIGDMMSEQSAVLTPPRQESRNGATAKRMDNLPLLGLRSRRLLRRDVRRRRRSRGPIASRSSIASAASRPTT